MNDMELVVIKTKAKYTEMSRNAMVKSNLHIFFRTGSLHV